MREAVCTTGRRFKPESAKLARETAQRLNIPYVPRGRESMEELRERYGVPWILVAKKGRLVLDTPGGELFFHPNMAHLRLKNLRVGEGDFARECLFWTALWALEPMPSSQAMPWVPAAQ